MRVSYNDILKLKHTLYLCKYHILQKKKKSKKLSKNHGVSVKVFVFDLV